MGIDILSVLEVSCLNIHSSCKIFALSAQTWTHVAVVTSVCCGGSVQLEKGGGLMWLNYAGDGGEVPDPCPAEETGRTAEAGRGATPEREGRQCTRASSGHDDGRCVGDPERG